MSPPAGPADLPSDTVLVRRDSAQLEWTEIEDQLIVWDGARGELHHLDPIATLVLRLCDGSTRFDETVADLARAFACEPDQIRADVARCVATLQQRGLLEAV